MFAAQVDFTHAGDLKVFVDEEQISAREREMSERGYLEGKKMATAFNLLRSNDLIWPYVINNYLKGKEPPPFDLLYWNSMRPACRRRTTRSICAQLLPEEPAQQGRMVIGGKLKDIKVPIYNLATREDHIAPAKSVLLGSKFSAAGALRAGRLRPHRRRRQSAGQDEVPVLDRPQPRQQQLDAGWARPRSIRAPGGRTGWNGSGRRTPPKYRREPGGGNLVPREDAPEPMLGSGTDAHRPARGAPKIEILFTAENCDASENAAFDDRGGERCRPGARPGADRHAQEDQGHRHGHARPPRVVGAVSYYDDKQQWVTPWTCAGGSSAPEERPQARRKLDVKLNPVTSATRIPLMANGTIDLECGSTTNNLERQKQVSFTITHFVTANRFVSKKSANLKTVDDLKGKTVVSTSGTTNIKQITEIGAQKGLNLNILAAKDHAEAFLMVETGRAAAFVMDDILLSSLVAASKSPQGLRHLRRRAFGRALRHHAPPRRRALQEGGRRGHDRHLRSGAINAIYDKWFLKPIPPKGSTSMCR